MKIKKGTLVFGILFLASVIWWATTGFDLGSGELLVITDDEGVKTFQAGNSIPVISSIFNFAMALASVFYD